MRRTVKRAIPSQFQRRLLLLSGLASLIMLVWAGWLGHLTIAQHEKLLERAELALTRSEYIPTARGRIFDRHGRVLAQNHPCFNVAVRYSLISGSWAYEQGRILARRENSSVWGELSEEARDRLIAPYQKKYRDQVDGLWRTLAAMGEVREEELEERRQTIVSRVSQLASHLWELWRQDRLLETEGPVRIAEVARPIAEHSAFHDLLPAINPEIRVAVERLIAEAEANEEKRDDQGRKVFNELAVWREVAVLRGNQREYPLETLEVKVDRSTFPGPLRNDDPGQVTVAGVGLQVIGSLRENQKEDVQRRPFYQPGAAPPDLGGYRPGDWVGRWGVEASMEDFLRGQRGEAIYRLDTGEQKRREPEPGTDVHLTLDIQLQARIRALMDPSMGLMKIQPWHFKDAETSSQLGYPLRGAAVVLEVKTGQVLAAVSVPDFGLKDLKERPQWVWEDPVDLPYINRAIGRHYRPGSTIKPLVLNAAMADGKLGDGEVIECTGAFDPKRPNVMRCWIYKASDGQYTHGPLTAPEAIARSCNIFFYTLGNRLGPDRLVWWLHQFGLGRYMDCGLNTREQSCGMLPDLPQAGATGTESLSQSEAIFMGIGQGRVDWTPLQAANAYAAIARGGVAKDPTLVKDQSLEAGNTVDLHLNRRGIQLALKGLYDAVNEPYGTTHHLTQLEHEPVFTIPGLRVMAKSGTADPGPVWLDLDGDKQKSDGEVGMWGDHAWTIVLVQKPGAAMPEYAVAVLVEFGGSGGACAGPIANQILYALRAEGYL
ncbi:MAG: hypothetical protein IT443_09535 [Phycisphaeraceae bacterium]|nr:hypothetical protein [Phycisphaeraceae bacterium]